MSRRRLGVMGGTFDPIHNGHLVAASEVAAALELDEVLFVPTGQPWQKSEVTPTSDRYLMAEIATAANPRFKVSKVDIDRGGPTYTVDTLRDLHSSHPDADLFFITGADAITSIVGWKDVAELWNLAKFVAVTRPGHKLDLPEAPDGAIQVLEIPALAISSTDIRERVAQGKPIWYLVPDGIVQFIAKHGLWTEEQRRQAEDLKRRIATDNLKLVRLAWADPHGAARAKAVTPPVFLAALANGYNINVATTTLDASGAALAHDPTGKGGPPFDDGTTGVNWDPAAPLPPGTLDGVDAAERDVDVAHLDERHALGHEPADIFGSDVLAVRRRATVDVLDAEIDAVDERTRQPPLILGGAARAALAHEARLARHAAAARIHRRHQLHPRREGDMRIGPRHADIARFQRLAQRIEHRALELGQFVEEQHAEMGKADLAGAHFQPAAGQRRHRGRVVGRAERPGAADPAFLERAGDRGDHRYLQRLGRDELR